MRWLIALGLMACGARSDLSPADDVTPDASSVASGAGCKPGDPMVVLAELQAPLYELITDGSWIYGAEDEFWSMPATGGSRKKLTATPDIRQLLFAAKGGVYFNGMDLEWMRHDGAGLHTVVNFEVAVVVPPVAYLVANGGAMIVREYSLADGSARVIASIDMKNGGVLRVTDRYVHVREDKLDDTIDHRIDRVDGTRTDIDLGSTVPWCLSSGFAPNAACFGRLCMLDERDDAVSFPVKMDCNLLTDDAWAYFSTDTDVMRIGLRNGIIETVVPNTMAFAGAEANGCVYLNLVSGLSSRLVRIPR